MTEIFAKVKYHYTPQADDELALSAGEVLEVIALLEDEWLLAKNSQGSSGLVPSNYLASLPDGWKVARDPDDNSPYYFNESSGVTQWEFPYCEDSDSNDLVAHPNGKTHGPTEPATKQFPGHKKGSETPPVSKSALSRQNSSNNVMYIIDEIEAEREEAVSVLSGAGSGPLRSQTDLERELGSSIESVAPFDGTFDIDTIAPLADEAPMNRTNARLRHLVSEGDVPSQGVSSISSSSSADKNEKYPGLERINKSSNDMGNAARKSSIKSTPTSTHSNGGSNVSVSASKRNSTGNLGGYGHGQGISGIPMPTGASPPLLSAGSRQSSSSRLISSPVKRGSVSTYNTPPVTQGGSNRRGERDPSSASQSTANSSINSSMAQSQSQYSQSQGQRQGQDKGKGQVPSTTDLLNNLLDSQLNKGIDSKEVRICRQVKDLLLSINEGTGSTDVEAKSPVSLLNLGRKPTEPPQQAEAEAFTPPLTPPSERESYVRNGIQSVDSRRHEYEYVEPVSGRPDLDLSLPTDPEDHRDTVTDEVGDLREIKKVIAASPLEKSKSMTSFDAAEEEEDNKFQATMSAVLAAADDAIDGNHMESELTEAEEDELALLSGELGGNASRKRDPIVESQSDSENSSWDGNASDHSGSGRYGAGRKKKGRNVTRQRSSTEPILASESETESESYAPHRNIPVEEERRLERERQDVLQDIPEFETPSAPTHSKPKKPRNSRNKTPRLDLASMTPDPDQDECYVQNNAGNIVNHRVAPDETPRGSQISSQCSSPESHVSVGKLPAIPSKQFLPQKGGRRVGRNGEVVNQRFDHLIPGTAVTDDSLLQGAKYPQCRSLVHRPTFIQPNEDKQNIPPRAQLYLEHVHGYNGDNGTTPLTESNIINNHVVSSHNNHHVLCGSTGKLSGVNKGKNVLYLRDGRIMFPAAGLVVLMDIETNEQSFFSGHTDDVTCLALNPTNGSVVASGQLGKEGKIFIWNSANITDNKMLTKAPIELSMTGSQTAAANTTAGVSSTNSNATHINMRGVFTVDFSPDGRFLLAVGMDDMHTLSIFDWRLNTVLVSSSIGRVELSKVQFNAYLFKSIDPIKDGHSPHKAHVSPRDLEDGNPESATSGCYTIVSCGSRQVKFWIFHRVLERVDQDAPGKKAVHGGGGGLGRQMGKEFKGRQMHVPKRKQLWENRYVLEGNAGIFPKNNPEVPEFTCFCCVENAPSNPDALTGNNSRIYCGTANGCIYVWKQLENKHDDQQQQQPQAASKAGRKSLQPHNDHSNLKTKWLPRGKLLSIVTDIHSEPISQITDMDYSGSYNDYIKKHYFYSNKDRYYQLYASKKKRRKFVEKIVTSGRDGYVNIWKIQKFSQTEIMNHRNAVIAAEQEGRDIGNLIPLEHLSSYYVMSSLSNFEKYNENPNSPVIIGDMDENPDLAVYDTNYASYGGVPRSIQWNDNCSAVIIGTTNNCIYELRANSTMIPSPSKHHVGTNSHNGSTNTNTNTTGTGSDNHSGSESGVGVTDHSQMSNNVLSVDTPDELVLQQIIRAHIGKVTRVASHPYLPLYATISTDNTIRLWDLGGKHLLNSCSSVVDRPTAIQFSPNGLILLVGNIYGEITAVDCGYEEDGNEIDGELVYSHWKSQSMWSVPLKKQVTKVHQPKDNEGGDRVGRKEKEKNSLAKSGINVIKFSPSGSVVAIGCKDSAIYILSTTQGFRRVSVCKGHSGAIRQLDFCFSYATEEGETSDEGIILQSNDTVRELLYWDIMTGKQISVVNKIRDVAWSSWSCTVGWPVQVRRVESLQV